MDTNQNLFELLEQALSVNYPTHTVPNISRRTTPAFTYQRSPRQTPFVSQERAGRVPPALDAVHTLIREYNIMMSQYQENMTSMILAFVAELRDVRAYRANTAAATAAANRNSEPRTPNPTPTHTTAPTPINMPPVQLPPIRRMPSFPIGLTFPTSLVQTPSQLTRGQIEEATQVYQYGTEPT